MTGKLTPRKAIRQICLDCVGTAAEVRGCQGDTLVDGACLFYRYRLGRGRPSVRLIRKYCIWCMGGSQLAVKSCPSRTCPVLPYRMGRNLAYKGRKGPMAGRFRSRIQRSSSEQGVGQGVGQ